MMDEAATAPTLTVRLLGRLEIHACGIPVRLAGRHAQALAALLALKPRPRLRDAIAADLWPDFDGPSASSLRQALWLVRSGLASTGIDPDVVLEVGQDTIGVRRQARVDLDVTTFETLVADGPANADQALTLYHGDLVEGLGHECFAADRERLSDLYEDALASVADARLAAGDVVGARYAATRLLARDPLREEAHSVLIAVYGMIGSRSQVVRQYRRLCSTLRTELAVRPLPETEATYQAALARSVERSADRAASRVFERPKLTRVLAPSA
ncbi:MAG TPA: BTAD domain-containing putative transcriptional regulator [Candidatus Limnocylindrales bacterium]|jgi:DNA-binding SARP family transcriptional activator|nr:BTAD domain-containing putative transcriptional regulator [Candidatus Limnocylindrales bacterium]